MTMSRKQFLKGAITADTHQVEEFLSRIIEVFTNPGLPRFAEARKLQAQKLCHLGQAPATAGSGARMLLERFHAAVVGVGANRLRQTTCGYSVAGADEIVQLRRRLLSCRHMVSKQ